MAGAWDTAVALAESRRLPVWASPATGGVRLGFPEGHPNFRGVLPLAIGPVGQTLEGHDLILVAGSSVFPYYPHIPGPLLPKGAALVAITSDPDEAVRAPMGVAIPAHRRAVNEVRLYLAQRAPAGTWVCERTVFRRRDPEEHPPDAVLEIGGERHAIEAELTRKRDREIRRIVAQHCVATTRCSTSAAPAPTAC